MQEIKFLLDRFKNLVSTDAVLKRVFIEAVKKATGHDLPAAAIKINKGSLYVVTKPALKSEIFLRRELIMAELEQTLTGYKFKKIV